MKAEELKALAEDLQINHEYCPKEVIHKASTAILELLAQLEPFAPYLKDGETPIERLERERKDNSALLGLLEKDRERIAELKRELEEARKDAELLDWMIFYSARVRHSNDAEYCEVVWQGDEGEQRTKLFGNAREAIRAAIKEQT